MRTSGREVPLETPDAMSCADAQRRFFAYLDRALAGEDAEALEAHLEACLECCDRLAHHRSVGEDDRSSGSRRIPTRVSLTK